MDDRKRSPDFHSHHHPAPDFRWAFRILKVNRMWVGSALALSISVALFQALVEKSSYMSTSVLALSSRDHASIGASLRMGGTDDFAPKVYSMIEQFKGRQVCDDLDKTVNARMKNLPLTGVGEMVPHQACQNLVIELDSEKQQVRIHAHSNDPVLSQIIANEAAQIFMDRDQDRLVRRSSELKQFLSTQELELGKQVKEIETEKTLFQADSSMISATEAEKSIVDHMHKSEQDAMDLAVQIKNNANLIQQTSLSLKDLKASLTTAQAPMSSFYLNQIQYRLNMLQYRKSMIRGKGDTDTEKSLDQEINEIMGVYRKALDGKGDLTLTLGGDPVEYLKSLRTSMRTLLRDREAMLNQRNSLDANIRKKGDDMRDLASNIQRLG